MKRSLRQLRTEAGMRMRDVADALLTSDAEVQRWETVSAPCHKHRRRLAELFGVDADDVDWRKK